MTRTIEGYARYRLMQLALSTVVSQTVYCAAELGLADALVDGPLDVDELAERVGCSSDHLRRMLRALSTVGVFKCSNGTVSLSPVSPWLVRSRRDSLWPIVSFFGREMTEALRQLPYTVRTGEAGWDRALGKPFWKYLEDSADRGAVFDEMMSAFGESEAEAVVAAYDFSGVGTVIDVGGGNGSLLDAVLRENPGCTGILFDIETVVERARDGALARRWGARWESRSGDFFRSVPRAEMYLLRHVLHDWDDDHAGRIMQVCRAHCPDGARLLVIEELIDDEETPSTAKWMDVGMMVNCRGRERTLAEYRALLEGASFQLSRVIRTEAPISVLEAIPV